MPKFEVVQTMQNVVNLLNSDTEFDRDDLDFMERWLKASSEAVWHMKAELSRAGAEERVEKPPNMSPEEKEEQRRSFAFGNTHIGNPRITRELIDQEADRLEKP